MRPLQNITFMTKIPTHLSSVQMADVKKINIIKSENNKIIGTNNCVPTSVALKNIHTYIYSRLPK